ncbi:unnamed protein product, partial [marine sediment metagenome]
MPSVCSFFDKLVIIPNFDNNDNIFAAEEKIRFSAILYSDLYAVSWLMSPLFKYFLS